MRILDMNWDMKVGKLFFGRLFCSIIEQNCFSGKENEKGYLNYDNR